MLFFGYHACFAALNNPLRYITEIFVCDEQLISRIPERHHKKIQVLPKKELDKKLPQHTLHQGIIVDLNPLAQCSYFEADETLNQCIVVLDQVTDPHNVGAIVRSSAVFGAKAIIATERHMPKESGVMAKSASGALETVPLIMAKNLARAIEDLKEQNFWTVGLSERGEYPLHQRNLKGRIALILGSEGKGLRQKTKGLCDFYSYLPFFGTFSTLNVSNAAAIALYEIQRQTQDV